MEADPVPEERLLVCLCGGGTDFSASLLSWRVESQACSGMERLRPQHEQTLCADVQGYLSKARSFVLFRKPDKEEGFLSCSGLRRGMALNQPWLKG